MYSTGKRPRGGEGVANFDRCRSVLQVGGKPLEGAIMNGNMNIEMVQENGMFNRVKGIAYLPE